MPTKRPSRHIFIKLALAGIICAALFYAVWQIGAQMRPSLQGRLYEAVARLSDKKNSYIPMPDGTPPSGAAAPSQRMFQSYTITSRLVNGRSVWTIAPQHTAAHHIYYLHGGGYVANISTRHWQFLHDLLDNCDCAATVPDYPLAPQANVQDAFAMILPVYTDLIATTDAANITLMGDSAGAGLSLALAMQLREAGMEQPANLVLISPWLDVTMNNPDIAAADERNPDLPLQWLIDSGQLWAGELDRTNYRVSPIYGTLPGLAPISLYIGTHDVLVADTRKFRTQAAAADIPINYHEYRGMTHTFALTSWMPERQDVLNNIARLINSE
jgi:monoterpene epsilon-lactone hydrolase